MRLRSITRAASSRSQAFSSSGISHASRLNSVQRTFAQGNPESSQSALRYGV